MLTRGGGHAFELIENDLPETVKQITGSGGFQLLYKIPAGVTVKSTVNLDDGKSLKLSGIDIRGEGGYIIAPPSNHHTGGGYRWEDDFSPDDQELVEIPLAFLERFRLIKRNIETSDFASVSDACEVELDQDRVTEICSALSVLSPDSYDEWLRVGMALHSTGAGSQAFAIWDSWSQQTTAGNYKSSDQLTTWQSFSSGSGINIETIFRAAYDNGWEGHSSSVGSIVLSGDEDEVDPAPSMLERIDADCPHVSEYYLWNDAAMIRGGLTLLVGQPKVGKTELIISMSIAAVTGGCWLNGNFSGTPSVLWLNAEIIRPFIKKRLEKYLVNMSPEIKSDGLSRFWSTAPDEFNGSVVPDLTKITGQQWLKKLVDKKRPDIVVIDPLANWIRGADENKPQELVEAISNIRKSVDGASVVIVHHVKKSGDLQKERPTFDEIRGSGALRGLYDTGIMAYKRGDNVRVIFECRHSKTPEDVSLVADKYGLLRPELSITNDGSYAAFPSLVDLDREDRARLAAVSEYIKGSGGCMQSSDLVNLIQQRLKIGRTRAYELLALGEVRGLYDVYNDAQKKYYKAV